MELDALATSRDPGCGAEAALLASVTRALGLYVRDAEPASLFQEMLGDLLSLTGSEYGYIAEARTDEDGAAYLRTWAITNIAWDDATRALYDERVVHGQGLEFRNLDTLFGWGLRTGEVVLTNDAVHDERAGGVPAGHTPLRSYLALPIVRGDQVVGQAGVANRPGGYDEALVAYLDPFVTALGNLIEGYRSDQERREAQAALARSERELQALIGHLSDVVTVLEPDGSWRYSSLAGTRLLGYPRGYDVPIFDLLHDDDREPAARALEEVLAGERGPEVPIELRVRAADGTFHRLEMFGEDLRDDPAIHGVLITSHDVTERRAAEHRLEVALAQLGALVTSLRDALLFVDDTGRVVYANQAFCDAFGFEGGPSTVTGRSIVDLRSAATRVVADPEEFVARVEAIYAAWEPVSDEELLLRDGRTLARDYVPVPLDAVRRGHLWLYRDITERKALEAQRTLALDQQRAARAAIEEQNRSLRELASLKDEFVATVSHELRTPVTAVASFAGLLQDDAVDLPEEQREFAAIIERNASRLLHLVDDLLLLGRLESGQLPVQPGPVDLAAHLDVAVASIRPAADAGGVTVTAKVPPGPPVRADAQRLDQVLANLLSNAVKFTPDGGAVTVEARHEPDGWVLEVRDTGVGIPEAEQATIFRRFTRGSNADDRVPGSGLGLVITRAIVERHGGTIDLTSVQDEGTTVVVRLPDEAPSEEVGP